MVLVRKYIWGITCMMETKDELLKEMERLGVVALEADGEITVGAVRTVLGLIDNLEKNMDLEADAANIARLQERKRQLSLEAIDSKREENREPIAVQGG
jgi:hypothetical protein